MRFHTKLPSTIYDDSAALNAHTSFPEPEEADPLRLPQDKVHVEVLDTEHTLSILTQIGVTRARALLAIIIITVRTTMSPAGTRSMAIIITIITVRTTGSPAGTRSMAIIIIIKTRALLASTGNPTLNREATIHAQRQLADA